MFLVKNEGNIFYYKLGDEYFLFDYFFEERNIFRENCERQFFSSHDYYYYFFFLREMKHLTT